MSFPLLHSNGGTCTRGDTCEGRGVVAEVLVSLVLVGSRGVFRLGVFGWGLGCCPFVIVGWVLFLSRLWGVGGEVVFPGGDVAGLADFSGAIGGPTP